MAGAVDFCSGTHIMILFNIVGNHFRHWQGQCTEELEDNMNKLE